jgi:1-acyl-sn-glycerol-3-phosphate acyltransferase
MKPSHRHPARVFGRVLWLGGELLLGAARFLLQKAGPGRFSSPAARSFWLHQTARRLLPVFDLKVTVTGPIPSAGLLVCNHLSYLDIVVLAGMTPAVFVAKSEVRRWPVFGWFARKSGCIFVERQRRFQTSEANSEIAAAVAAGLLVVLFPEGTSSDGRTVLPFKSSLLECAAQTKPPIFAGLVRYELDDGDVGEEVCYWKDHTLGPHLLNLMSKRAIRCELHFTRVQEAGNERKALALQLHREVAAMREATTATTKRPESLPCEAGRPV